MPRWESEGLPIETGEPAEVKPTKYPPPELNKDAVRCMSRVTLIVRVV